MKQNDVYRIWNKKTQKYESAGYNNKTSWRRFPKEQIAKFKDFDKNYCVHKFVLEFECPLNSKEERL